MQFNPAIHTKEFLLSNPKIALRFFTCSSVCREIYANDLNMLRLIVDDDGTTVAHNLAQYHSDWLLSDASKSTEVLSLAKTSGMTVAHHLAQYQPDWLMSDASKSPDILLLEGNNGWIVAYEILMHQSENINIQSLMQKQILTLDYFGDLLAEDFTEKFGDTHGWDTSTIAMKLIEQGAAYKHSKPMVLKVGDTLLKQCEILMQDNLDVQISLKQLMALYSTFSHNVAKIISTQEQKSLHKWQDILLKSENMILQHLNTYPELYDIEHTVDIFCEPGDNLLKKFQSEWILSVELGGLPSSISSNDIEPIKQAIY